VRTPVTTTNVYDTYLFRLTVLYPERPKKDIIKVCAYLVDDRRVFMPRRPRRRFCRRCGAEIATADLMDVDPGIDRQHFSLVLESGERRQLSPAEWRLFTELYQRRGRIVPLAELATATRISKSKLRGLLYRFRRSLGGSRFSVLTHFARGCELVVHTEERR
jgi:hypothetical protein